MEKNENHKQWAVSQVCILFIDLLSNKQKKRKIQNRLLPIYRIWIIYILEINMYRMSALHYQTAVDEEKHMRG